MGLFDGFGGERSNNRRTNNGEMSDIEASLTTLSSVAVKESETNKNAQKSHIIIIIIIIIIIAAVATKTTTTTTTRNSKRRDGR